MDNRLKVRTGCKILAVFETIARFPLGKSGDDTYVYLFWFCPILVVIYTFINGSVVWYSLRWRGRFSEAWFMILLCERGIVENRWSSSWVFMRKRRIVWYNLKDLLRGVFVLIIPVWNLRGTWYYNVLMPYIYANWIFLFFFGGLSCLLLVHMEVAF